MLHSKVEFHVLFSCTVTLMMQMQPIGSHSKCEKFFPTGNLQKGMTGGYENIK